MSRRGCWIIGGHGMIGPGKPRGLPAGLCWYSLQKLPPLLDAFSGEIAGVREAKDIEYIHRMRVASRRLRAALPLFRPCFPRKQYLRWMQELTKITRALGEARDADVQIASLEKALKKMERNAGPKRTTRPGQPSSEPGIRFLLLDLRKKRIVLQKHVTSALSDLEKSHVTDEMRAGFAAMDAELRTTRKPPRVYGIPPVAALRIGKRLATLLSFEPWVLHPEAVAEHHATRIAAKKLRYTMEIYGTLYRNALRKPLARVKKLQEILGDIHDCDVWIDHITLLLLRERSLLRSGRGSKRPDPTTLASLKILLHEREAERKRLYRRFVRFWQSLSRGRIWDELKSTLDTGRKVRFRPPAAYREEDALEMVYHLMDDYPDGQAHRKQVTRLALMLFDGLLPLHNLGAHDRFLLSCAGELHDIGETGRGRGNSRRGAGIVFSHESLPFDLEERGILAWIIQCRRGKVQFPSSPWTDVVPPDSHRRALILAAILRVADGFDDSRTGSVHELRVALSDGEVTCSVSGGDGIAAEKEHALARTDLFRQVFEKNLVIP